MFQGRDPDAVAEAERAERDGRWKPFSELKLDGRMVLLKTPSGVAFAPALPQPTISRKDLVALARDGVWPNARLHTPTHFAEIVGEENVADGEGRVPSSTSDRTGKVPG